MSPSCLETPSYCAPSQHLTEQTIRYNPILGEQFRCRYLYENGTEGFYIAEQVSHHPPISAYYYVSPQNQLLIQGELRPKSKFLGNSAATLMDGQSRLYFTDRPGEMYEVTMPNMYARGILFGKMVLELGDVSSVRCAKTGLHCDLEFKTKGFFSGSYNAISGKVKDKDGNTLYDISGHWNETMYIKGHKVSFVLGVKKSPTPSLTSSFSSPRKKRSFSQSKDQRFSPKSSTLNQIKRPMSHVVCGLRSPKPSRTKI